MSAGDATAPTPTRSLGRRLSASAFAIIVLVLPAVVVGAVWHPETAGPMILGAVVGLVTVLTTKGRGFGLGVSALLLLVTPLSVLSGSVPVTGACMMALLCAASGITALWGLEAALTLVPLMMAFFIIAPPSVTGAPVDRMSTPYLVSAMLLVAGGSLWAVVVVPVLARQREVPDLHPARRLDAVVYTVAITILCSVSTLVVLIVQPGSQGAWLILTILAVAKLGPRATLSRSLDRVMGTILGAVLALAVASVVASPGARIGIAVLTLILAMTARSGPRYWLYVAFLTATVVLLSSPGDVVQTGEYRVLYTVVGAGLVMLSAAIVLVYQQLRASGRIQVPEAAAGAAG